MKENSSLLMIGKTVVVSWIPVMWVFVAMKCGHSSKAVIFFLCVTSMKKIATIGLVPYKADL